MIRALCLLSLTLSQAHLRAESPEAPPLLPEISADDSERAPDSAEPAAETTAADPVTEPAPDAANPAETSPTFDSQGYLLRKAFNNPESSINPDPLRIPIPTERMASPAGYQATQTGNNIELVTPYGRRLLFGDFGFNSAREYRLEIPLDQLRPPEVKRENAEIERLRKEQERLEAEAKAAKAALDAAKGEKPAERAVAQIPPRVVLEYDNTDRLVLEANRLYNRGKYYQASLTVEEILAKRPEYARGWVMKGSLLFVQGHNDLAKTAWEKALELDPSNAEVKSFLGRLP